MPPTGASPSQDRGRRIPSTWKGGEYKPAWGEVNTGLPGGRRGILGTYAGVVAGRGRCRDIRQTRSASKTTKAPNPKRTAAMVMFITKGTPLASLGTS